MKVNTEPIICIFFAEPTPGFAAGAQPGPFQTNAISQSLVNRRLDLCTRAVDDDLGEDMR
jgi:hypothetical protein